MSDKTCVKNWDWFSQEKERSSMEARLFELDAKMGSLSEKASVFPEKVTSDYQYKLDISWLFHDNALDGVVLSYSELKAAIDQRIISDVSLIPTYEEVRTHKRAADYLRDLANSKKPPARGAGASRTAGFADATIRFSLLCSRRRVLAVRNNPCSRATSAAAAHNGAGIGKRPRWDFRQRSKRR